MKMYQLGSTQAQITKLRTALEAGSTPINQIKRPPGMENRVYAAKLYRLASCEAKYRRLLSEGLQKWHNSKNLTA